MADDTKLPDGRFGRLAKMAGLGFRAGAGRLVGRSAEKEATDAAKVFGQMRGIAAKLGQLTSYVDGLVPDERTPAWQEATKGLRSNAPSSPPAAVRALLEEDLDAPVPELFAEWSDEPFASASIGQVHRAKLHDGRDVAVKVQHPGIVSAIEADLSNAGILQSFASSFMGRRFDTKAMLETIRTRFREELDYVLEARRIELFRALHKGDPLISIPEVIASRSGRRVLTTTFVTGHGFEEACTASETERRAWAETLWRYVYKSILVGGLFNADPHPGNYLFQPGGRVAFLDYGCVQIVEGHQLRWARQTHKAAMDGDETAFRAAASTMLRTKPGRLDGLAQDYVRLGFTPVFESPYRVTRPYAASLVHEMKRMGGIAMETPDHEFFTMPTEVLFLNRLQFGFYSVLARLDVATDFRAVEQSYWGDVPPDA